MKSNKGLAPLAQVLTAFFDSHGWSGRLRLHQVFSFWDGAVGAAIALHAQPHLLRGTTLWVRVCDSIWLQHLQFDKMLILEKLNSQLGENLVTDIRFSVDAALETTSPQPEVEPPPRPPLTMSKAPPELEEQLKGLDDGELRALIRRLWNKQHHARQD